MSIVIVTGSGGLIGSEAVRFFSEQGFDVVGVDSNMRADFFGEVASVAPNIARLRRDIGFRYQHHDLDIRSLSGIDQIFRFYETHIEAIVHCASQPSHDWAASDPHTDFGVNAVGTLNLLEAARRYCPEAPFVFMSSSKVYGDWPNKLNYYEKGDRLEPWANQFTFLSHHGFSEIMPIDRCLHSLFGVSKLSADLLVQEYGRYFGMKTVCFRPGCLTGPNHAGVEQHGFLSHLVKCAVTGAPYKIIGYKGKQVRDNIHSHDVVSAMWEFVQRPRSAEVYNLGGGRHSNCSILEAIADCERLTGKKMQTSYVDTPRIGDHKWFIGDPRKWQSHYPNWTWTYDHERLITEMVEAEKVLSVVIPARGEGIEAVVTHGKIKAALLCAGIESEVIIERDDGEPHGFGLAVRRGLDRATGAVVAIVMADGSDSPSDLIDYYRIISSGAYDCAFGTRWYKGHRPADYPWPKYVLNRLANNAIMLLFGHGIGNDCTNAFKMYRREVIEAIQPLESEHFDLTVEMPLKAYLKGFKIAHPPISWQNRKTGKSKWKISELGSKYIRRVLQLWWRSRF